MIFKYLPHGQPMPKGFELKDDLQGTHHGHFAVLIVEKDENTMTQRDADILIEAVSTGALVPEDYPGKNNEAFRLLIRSIRASL